MKVVFLTSTSGLPDWLEELKTDYEKKLSYWFHVEVKCLKTKVSSRDEKSKKLRAESDEFLEFIKPEDIVVLCDERGKPFTSVEFSRQLNLWLQTGKKRLVFIIGGAYGVDEGVKSRADIKLRLSDFVFNHHIAMAVILEQVYRATTILKGIKYHNE